MARRAFLHVGTAKSGTTYLQDLWWQHRGALRDRGLLVPGATLREHFVAAAVVKGMDAFTSTLSAAELRTWGRLVEQAGAWPDDALISHEHFSDSPPEAAAAALADLTAVADEVHLLLTVRDLARVLPSAWQERVKQGARQPFPTFLETVQRQEADQKFWRYQDVPAILDRWSVGLPPERVHLVTVPPSGAPRDELWRRTGAVLGVEVSDLDAAPRLPNDSLGIVEAELLRRVNTRIPRDRRDLELTRITKGPFARDVLAGSAPAEKFVLPAEHADWVRERSDAVLATLRERSYDVVGDLDDLVPAAPRAGRTPDEVTDEELLAVATTVLSRLGHDTAPDTLEQALETIATDLMTRASAAARAVSEPPPEVAEGGSRTALGRAFRRLAGGR